MDNQLNSLVQSYSSNYVQYKVTGNPSYQTGYTTAKQGLDSIINELQNEVNSGKKQVADFYQSGVEQKIVDLEQKNRKLHRGLITETDDSIAAKIRGEQSVSPPPIPISISTNQSIMLGVLSIAMIGMMMI